MRRWFRRWLAVLNGDELDAAIATHLESLEARHRERGLSAIEATLAARRDFGSVTRVREDYRAQATWRPIQEFVQDLRYVLRTMRRAPGFVLVTVSTLALGIGLTTTVFSVVNGVMLRALPYESPERQVRLRVSLESRDGTPDVRALTLSPTEVRELGERTRAFEHVGTTTLSLANWPGHAPRWSGGVVTASVFRMIGATPVLGRAFVPADEADGAPDVMVISDDTWQAHFSRDRRVIGQTITLEPALTLGNAPTPRTYTVIGVMPPGFEYLPGSRSSYWIPARPNGRGFVVARRSDNVDSDAALTNVAPVLREILARRPGPRPLGFEIVDLREQLVAPVRPALVALFGGVVVVMLIACVNVANLLLARSFVRQREIAIRSALGAARGRVLRMMLTESLALATLAVGAGLALALGGVRLLRWLATTVDRIDLGQGGGQLIPRLDNVAIDGQVLMFAVGVSLVTAVLCTLGSSLRLIGRLPSQALRAASVGTGDGSRRWFSARSALVVAEVMLSTTLLIGGALLVISFVRLSGVDAGYDAERLLTFQVSLPYDRYPVARLRDYAEELTSRLAAAPGVLQAAYANQLPLVALQDSLPVGLTPDAQRAPGSGADIRVVSRTYFSTFGVTLKSGRAFVDGDDAGQPRVLVMNESLARQQFGASASAIGRQVFLGRDVAPWIVVGVVADVRQMGLDRVAQPQAFIDARQWVTGLSPLFPLGPYFALRTTADEQQARGLVETLVREADREGVAFNISPMESIVSTTIARPRLYAVLLGGFALAGVSLALIGIYGVVSYTVSQRAREFGIRMALGARRADVLGLVLRQSLILTGVGVALGLLGAGLLSDGLQGLLFGLTPLDPATYVAAAAVFVTTATIAALVPARQATHVDPLVAMKAE